MLQIKNTTFIHRKDLKPLLKDFQLTIQPLDKAVIIGEEGNGKSTLLKWIYDPELVEEYIEAKGERIFPGERLAYLPQEMPEEEKQKSLQEFFETSAVFYEKSPRDLARIAREVGLPADFWFRGQQVGSLSGGEKVKIYLMRLLLEEPTILLLDEPFNDLDLPTLSFLEEMIRDFKGAVIFISHDETLIENTATMVIHLEQVYRKRECRYTVEKMTYPEYVQKRLSQFDKQEQEAQDDLRQKKIRDEKYRRIYEKVEHDQRTISRQDPSGGRLLKKKMHAVKSMGRRFEKEDEAMTKRPIREEAINFKLSEETTVPIPQGKTVLIYHLDQLVIPGGATNDEKDMALPASDLSSKTTLPASEVLETERILAKGIDLRVTGPQKICIIGRNGAGKTTLLKKIWKELAERTDIKPLYMPQNYEEMLDMDLTPVEYLQKNVGYEKKNQIELYLGALRFTFEEMAHPIQELSGGQKAKLFLLMMNLTGANVLVLDEPTRNFSPLSGPVIRRMLKDFAGAIISISHDRKYMKEVCDTIFELTEDGLKRVFLE